MLENRGLIERDAESAWLSGDPGQAGALDDLIGHSSAPRRRRGGRGLAARRARHPARGTREARMPVPLRLEPLDLMARLAALVPPPRMHLTRYHGLFAPHSRLRAPITPAGRGPGGKCAKPCVEAPAAGDRYGGIASIEEAEIIARILAHRERDCGGPDRARRRTARGERACEGHDGRIERARGLVRLSRRRLSVAAEPL